MTEEETNDLLRWAAESVLGWRPHVCGHATLHYGHDGLSDHDAISQNALTSWPGFGLVAEAANARHWYMYATQGAAYAWTVHVVDFLRRGCLFTGADPDPGFAAWAALREAMAQPA